MTATATLTGTPDPTVAGAFILTGGSGTWNGAAIALDLPSATAGTFQTANFPTEPGAPSYEYDNVVYTSGNDGLALDEFGLLFSSATDNYTSFAQGTGYVYTGNETAYGFNAPVYTLTLTDLGPSSVFPEPTSIALLATGLLATAGLLHRRRRLVAAASGSSGCS